MHLLQRAIVEVEAEPNEQPLVRRREAGLVRSRASLLDGFAHQADSTVSAATRPVRYAYRAASVLLEIPSLR